MDEDIKHPESIVLLRFWILRYMRLICISVTDFVLRVYDVNTCN